MNPWEMRNERLGPAVVNTLISHGFDAKYVHSREQALFHALEWIPQNALVGWGGSQTVVQIGLLDAVKSSYSVIDRDSASSKEERLDCMRRSLLADVFLMGANAISEDGCLINMDGAGNRVAALAFGPTNVIVVAGMNKIVSNVQAGIARIETIAGPVNMMRFVQENTDTGCAKTGKCCHCNTKDCICNSLVITRRCRPSGRIKVLLVGEDLGI